MAAPSIASVQNVPFTEGDSGVALAGAADLVDTDGFLTGATVLINDLRPGDYLHFVDQNGITGAYDPDTGLLTLTGVASVADYQTAIRSVLFMHGGDANFGGTDNTRVINVTITDGTNSSTDQGGIVIDDGGGPSAGADLVDNTTPIADYIDGLAGDDEIYGFGGDDYLKGGDGADEMFGGTGDDTYVVENIGDVADETGGDGTDLVISRINWTLGADLENLTLGSAGGNTTGTGNALDNVITGNAGSNVLTGLGGADTLNGGGGHDQLDGGDGDDALNGGNGNDELSGGAGTDTLTGGAGNDEYTIDALDTVVEAVNGGVDTILAAFDADLGDYANVENLTLSGAATTGTGDAGDNEIRGTAGNNQLSGLDGADRLFGEDGDDTLIGGNGADRLSGGTGADLFEYATADALNRDRILDLDFAEGDIISLQQIDADSTLGGDQDFVFVSQFTRTAGEAMLVYVASANLTQVRIDTDGDGRADATLALVGDFRGTEGNLYTGGGDVDGGWLL